MACEGFALSVKTSRRSGRRVDAATVAQVDICPFWLALTRVFELADVVEAGRDVERILERLGVRAGRHTELAA